MTTQTRFLLKAMFGEAINLRLSEDGQRVIMVICEENGPKAAAAFNSRAAVDDLIDKLDALRDLLPYDDERDMTPEEVAENEREARTLRHEGQREAARNANIGMKRC